jgi:hypothetical protein
VLTDTPAHADHGRSGGVVPCIDLSERWNGFMYSRSSVPIRQEAGGCAPGVYVVAHIKQLRIEEQMGYETSKVSKVN